MGGTALGSLRIIRLFAPVLGVIPSGVARGPFFARGRRGAQRSRGICSWLLLWEPLFSQIFPGWIHALDQEDLLIAAPALELLFSRNRSSNVGVGFNIHESVRSILRRKAGNHTGPVLAGSANHVVRHSRVQIPRTARHDVHKVVPVHCHLTVWPLLSSRAEGWPFLRSWFWSDGPAVEGSAVRQSSAKR